MWQSSAAPTPQSPEKPLCLCNAFVATLGLAMASALSAELHQACAQHLARVAPGGELSTVAELQVALAGSPVAQQLHLTGRLVAEFLEEFLASPSASPSPAPAPAPARGSSSAPAKSPSRPSFTPKTLLQRRGTGSHGRASPPPTAGVSNGGGEVRYFSSSQFLAACEELVQFAAHVFRGTVIIGNGRSVLGLGAGPTVDRYDTVIRFNDYQIEGYERDIGSKVDVWVMSDWTIATLLHKYPERRVPVLCAIPYRFMGKPYYHERRAELEAELPPAMLSRITFVPAETVQRMVEENRFGDRWPSSGLITIVHMLMAKDKVYLHGFDFFKEIGARPLPLALAPRETHSPRPTLGSNGGDAKLAGASAGLLGPSPHIHHPAPLLNSLPAAVPELAVPLTQTYKPEDCDLLPQPDRELDPHAERPSRLEPPLTVVLAVRVPAWQMAKSTTWKIRTRPTTTRQRRSASAWTWCDSAASTLFTDAARAIWPPKRATLHSYMRPRARGCGRWRARRPEGSACSPTLR